MKAKIYRPVKTAMQSGRGKTVIWVLEYEREIPKYVEPLMGWVGSKATTEQVKLNFPTKDAAVKYAESQGLEPLVTEPEMPVIKPKAYADNFRFDKIKA